MDDQIILIDKPAGISSFGIVAKVRATLRQKFGHKIKVGHTGTLDPFATGLLIILTGKNTKKSNEFLKLDKVYEATLKLGFTSSTGDPEGQIQQYHKGNSEESAEAAAEQEGAEPCEDRREDPVSEELPFDIVESTIQNFVGKITQTPPKFSAIKINGKRAYKLARENKDFEIPSRQVEIYSIDILEYNFPILKIRTHVSSGTYIRTLAEDIGKVLNTGAYLTELRRIKIANYNVKDAIPLDSFTNN